MPSSRALSLGGALDALLCLGGGFALAFPAVGLVNQLAPAFADRLGRTLFLAVLLLCCGAGGHLWAVRLRRRLGRPPARRWGLAAALGFGLAGPLALYGLTGAESLLFARSRAGLPLPPMHVVFAALFAAAVCGVVGLTTAALGLAARLRARSLLLAARCALAATLAFLAVDLAFDRLGWRVGAPGAERRATMLVVLAAGVLAATATGGAVVARSLAARPPDF